MLESYFLSLLVNCMTNVFLVCQILQVNDNAPEFLDNYSFTVQENNPRGVYIGAVSASDRDALGVTGAVGFYLYQEEMLRRDGQLVVRITDSGEILALISFDRELKDKYLIPVCSRNWNI